VFALKLEASLKTRVCYEYPLLCKNNFNGLFGYSRTFDLQSSVFSCFFQVTMCCARPDINKSVSHKGRKTGRVLFCGRSAWGNVPSRELITHLSSPLPPRRDPKWPHSVSHFTVLATADSILFTIYFRISAWKSSIPQIPWPTLKYNIKITFT